ncbi:MAG: hypothetical protein EKK71_14820 [Candidatus Competibacteraceae bacterium]|nr:MAG: hypothetical protein EKK71_14820 [Candidatus Competibacteraceae bacterium]
MRWRVIGRKTLLLLVLLILLVGMALLAMLAVRTMTLTRLAVADDVIARIWWPATTIRMLAYALLAWGLYPIWVRAHLPEAEAAVDGLPPTGNGLQTDAGRTAIEADGVQRQRAVHRQWWVFGGCVGLDLWMTQFPYWLLRG